MSPAEAAVTVKLAEALGEQLTDTGAALAEGSICRDRAEAIRTVIAGLPDVPADQLGEAEQILLEAALQVNSRSVRSLSKILAHYLDPDGLEPRDDLAKRKRSAWIRANGDGTQTVHWTETDENVALLQAALEPLMAPAPAVDGAKDTRSPVLRRADALVDLVSRTLRHGDLPTSRGARPHLVVTVTDQSLRNGHGLGITASGEHLSAATVQRIACDALVTAIRLDSNGVPLSMGRTRRTVTPQQWVALVARDRGCVFPDCQAPPHFCDAHHIRHWIHGGPTDLDNIALLCGRHHDAVHHEHWSIEMAPDGRPQLRPPPWIDVEQRPRRNQHWQTQVELHLR